MDYLQTAKDLMAIYRLEKEGIEKEAVQSRLSELSQQLLSESLALRDNRQNFTYRFPASVLKNLSEGRLWYIVDELKDFPAASELHETYEELAEFDNEFYKSLPKNIRNIFTKESLSFIEQIDWFARLLTTFNYFDLDILIGQEDDPIFEYWGGGVMLWHSFSIGHPLDYNLELSASPTLKQIFFDAIRPLAAKVQITAPLSGKIAFLCWKENGFATLLINGHSEAQLRKILKKNRNITNDADLIIIT